MSDGHQQLSTRRAQFGDVTADYLRPKTITLYVNGDQYFYGRTITVGRRTHTWESFLREATVTTGVVFAARDILTPTHGTKINSLDELCDGSSYVVITKGNFKPVG